MGEGKFWTQFGVQARKEIESDFLCLTSLHLCRFLFLNHYLSSRCVGRLQVLVSTMAGISLLDQQLSDNIVHQTIQQTQ